MEICACFQEICTNDAPNKNQRSTSQTSGFVGPHLDPSLEPKKARTGRRFLFQPQGRSYGPMALINMLAMISMSLELHHAHTFTPSGCKGFNCQRQQNCIKPVRSYSTNSQNTAHLCCKNTMNTIDLLHISSNNMRFFGWILQEMYICSIFLPEKKTNKMPTIITASFFVRWKHPSQK